MNYEKLDKAIIQAVSESRGTPMWNSNVRSPAEELADGTGREWWRIVDARLQKLRKTGVIIYKKTDKAAGVKAGWYVC